MGIFSAPAWLGKEVSFAREKVEVRARNTEKSGWRRAFNIRSTQAVEGLPGNIPGDMVWSKQQYRISFGWKAIPANGLGLHPRDDKGIYLICDQKDCKHNAGTVTRLKFRELAQTIEQDFGLQTAYGEDFIYGQFYRADGGTHTFVRLLPSRVDVFDKNVLELLRARRMLRSLPFLFAGMDVMADLMIGKVHGPIPKVRARYLNAWRHAHAINRACEDFASDDSLYKDVKTELAKSDKADLAKVSAALAKLVPDKDGKWSVTGVKKAASAVARAFFGIQGILLKKNGKKWLDQLGMQMLTTLTGNEEYRLPIDDKGRAMFKNYLDQSMAVRQLDDRAKKNAFKPYTDALKTLLADAASDVEVLEIFGMQIAYSAFAEGFTVDVPAGLEKVVWIDLFDIAGSWVLKHRYAQPQDDPDYPGFVVSIYQRGSDFWIVPRGTASEDAAYTNLVHKTRDQADKKSGVATGVEADGDPAGIAYHAVKKYKKEFLQKLKDLGATPASKFLVTGHSLGGALTERLHLKLYEAGYKDVWSLAFSPPAPDGRTIARALYRDDQMGPAAFDRLVASGGTWDVVTKGGDTGACIPLRLLCIRPWAPGTFTPVPYSVVGDNTGDQRFLQHGTMFQHECRYAGFALVQSRSGDKVKEIVDDSYVVYDYCKDVTHTIFEATRTPWAMEQMLTPDQKEHATRVAFSQAPKTDAERDKQQAAAKSTKMLLVIANDKAVPQKDRGALEKQIADAAQKAGAQATVKYTGATTELQKWAGEATWAKGLVFCLGAWDKDANVQNWVRGLKARVVEVHPAAWKQTGQGANEPKHLAADGAAAYVQAIDWLAKQIT